MLQSQDPAPKRKLVHGRRCGSTSKQRGGIISVLARADNLVDVQSCTVRSANTAEAQGTPCVKYCRSGLWSGLCLALPAGMVESRLQLETSAGGRGRSVGSLIRSILLVHHALDGVLHSLLCIWLRLHARAPVCPNTTKAIAKHASSGSACNAPGAQ